MSRDASLEAEIQAKGLTAARVRPQDVQDAIESEWYFTGAEAASGQCPTIARDLRLIPLPLFLVTFCVLVLKNGFTVHGVSGVASPENFNAEIGRKVARDNAVNAIWPLLGYQLKDKLHAIATAVQPPIDNAYVAPGCEEFTQHPLHASVERLPPFDGVDDAQVQHYRV